MKNFQITLQTLGRSGNEKNGYTLEPDDIKEIWSHKKQFEDISNVIEWVKNEHKTVDFGDSYDKIDHHHIRYYVKITDEFDNSDEIGMICLEIREYKTIKDLPTYERYYHPNYMFFYYDGEWR